MSDKQRNPDAHLCVGGPFDGQWIASSEPRMLVQTRSPAPPGLEEPLLAGAPLPVFSIQVDVTEYVRRPISTSESAAHFSFVELWVPAGVDDHETMTRLMEGYRQPAPTPKTRVVEWIQDDGRLASDPTGHEFGAAVDWAMWRGRGPITLDGNFTAMELRAIADHMDKHTKGKP